jgi:hypothetical protein
VKRSQIVSVKRCEHSIPLSNEELTQKQSVTCGAVQNQRELSSVKIFEISNKYKTNDLCFDVKKSFHSFGARAFSIATAEK